MCDSIPRFCYAYLICKYDLSVAYFLRHLIISFNCNLPQIFYSIPLKCAVSIRVLVLRQRGRLVCYVGRLLSSQTAQYRTPSFRLLVPHLLDVSV